MQATGKAYGGGQGAKWQGSKWEGSKMGRRERA